MTAEIICVGTELLLGDILNTNAQFLSKEMAKLGIEMHYQTVVGDNPQRIVEALRIALDRADMAVLSGGLGPTKDDMTKERIAAFFGKKLVRDKAAYENMVQRVHDFGVSEISESLEKQADVPEGCMVLQNHNGTAPGCIIEKDGKTAILLPGPPKELKPMFEECCEIYLQKICGATIVSLNIKLKSAKEAPPDMVGEAPAADLLGDLLDSEDPTVATYAKDDGCLIRITAKAKTQEEALEKIAPMADKVRHIFDGVIKNEYQS